MSQTYNRSQLLEKYPELGDNFVMFPTDGGNIKIGFLNYSQNTVESRTINVVDYNLTRDVTFTLYTRNISSGIRVTDIHQLSDGFNKTEKTKFVIHGWMGKGNSTVCVNIKDAFLKIFDVNVFIVDWSPIAGNVLYPVPMMATTDVGSHYAKFLTQLINEIGVDPNDIHLIGHSLGAHISGFAGRGVQKKVGVKVGRITGLDPASPGFEWPLPEGGRLNKKDASFVDVLHTCAGFLGMNNPIGDVDFYPNGGGPPQPGCLIVELFEACSHSRSWELFVESILHQQPFLATPCKSFSFILGLTKCGGKEIPMGLQTPPNAKGLYYLKTTDKKPYIPNFVKNNGILALFMGKRKVYRSLPPVDFTLADAIKTDIVYKYFKDSTQECGKILTEENVAKEKMDGNIPTVLLIHGWTTDDTSPWYEPLKNGYFQLGPHNIIYVNWHAAGSKSYDISSANIDPVGRFIAEFLIASGLPPKNIHIIGHSLGSHLASFIGKSMFEISGRRLGRITALDPAGPTFENPLMTPECRLCETDADFVDVIHTDIQFYGYTAPIGHVDFYPNGGGLQPGCPPRESGENCSHARSTLYFIESLSTKSKAQEAVFKQVDYEVTVQVKDNGKEAIFGQHISKSARGVFYFETNSEKPFLK